MTRLLIDPIQFGSREKNAHEVQQPLDEAVLFVKTLTEPGDLIADLFIGTEIDADLVGLARRRVKEMQRRSQTI